MQKNKGFTLVETLVALALLGMLMLIIGSTMSVLSASSEKADDYVSANMGASYLLRTMQEDLVNNSALPVSVSSQEMQVGSIATYELTDSVIRRNSKTLSGIISGEFNIENDFLYVKVILSDRSILDVKFSLTGREA